MFHLQFVEKLQFKASAPKMDEKGSGTLVMRWAINVVRPTHVSVEGYKDVENNAEGQPARHGARDTSHGAIAGPAIDGAVT